MFDTIMKWIPMLLSILPFVFFCWINAKNNLDREFRNRQFLMPVFALIYSVVMMFFSNRIATESLSFIRKIPELLARISEDLAEWADNLITNLNFGYWIFLVCNIVILLGYLIVKRVFLVICNSVMKSDKNASGNDASLHGRIVSNFYVFQNDKNIWTVKEDFAQARTLLCWFYVGAILISSIVFLICKDLMADEYIKTPFYPVFGIMLVGELYFFLNGYTNVEFINDILGEDEESYRITNYSLMRKVLRNVFPDHLMTENTSINTDLDSIVSNDEIVKKLIASEEPGMENYGTYINSLLEEGNELDQNYISSVEDLLKGKSVLFNNPFYKDMSMYIFYPINRELLKHNKCLVILGRHGIEDNVCEWVSDGLAEVTTVPSLWKVGMLNNEVVDLDIGVISKSDILNVKLHEANQEFFENVSFVLLIEPSKLITTAQIGLNAIVKRCSDDGAKKLVYCSTDKNCDGLVDALSHILMTDISEVCATNKNQGTVSYMCWDTSEEYTHHRILPNISRYLGFGTELSLVALKNQVSEVKWYGGETYPVTDQFWINKQYYYDLLKYAGHPTKQEELGKIFKATPNLWSAEKENNAFLTVEDEGNNLFEMLRLFSTRITEQGFINVISPNYLLKEYMVGNSNVFENDPKAIPRIVADYARTERNITLRLILMLASKCLCEDYIVKEFSLVGIKVSNVKMQLWYEIMKWFSSPDEDVSYENIAERKLYQTDVEGIKREFDISVIRTIRKFDLNTGEMKDYYYVDNRKFIECNVFRLTCAEYIAEDEKGNLNYLGSELLDHVFHKHIPGQLFTLNGKYYEFLSITSDNKVLIRRAADHIDGRKMYRQIRHYKLSHEVVPETMGSCKDYHNFKVSKVYADISVKIPAYLDMINYDDFESAKTVVVNGIPGRSYKNKQLIKIDLPRTSDEVKHAVTILLNEIFRTIFAEDQVYLSAVTSIRSIEFADGISDSNLGAYHEFLKDHFPLTNYLFDDESDGEASIYIIEDSQLDLGLLISVERNIKRIFEIIYDYLDWHLETTELSKNPPVVETPIFPDPVPGTGIPKKKRLIDRIKDFLKRIKGKKKVKEIDDSSDSSAVESPTDTETLDTTGSTEDVEVEEGVQIETLDEAVSNDITKDIDTDNLNENNSFNSMCFEGKHILRNVEKSDDHNDIEFETEDEMSIIPEGSVSVTVNIKDKLQRLPYHEKNYLMFGSDKVSSHFSEKIILDTLSYLTSIGMHKNALTQARKNKDIAETIERTYKPYLEGTHYCDFCGIELSGTEYEVLIDGRERCMQCGRTAVKTGEEFTEIFKDVIRNMEAFFGIRINVGIKVEMVNSKKLAKRLGQNFIPTSNYDARTIGLAVSDSAGYTILIENGAPRVKSMMTIAHELTHIWQYLNWDSKQINSIYGKENNLEIYEGMATWVEIQYAAYINETAMAKRDELNNLYRDDEYGRGFKRYLEQYALNYTGNMEIDTPFKHVPPLK